jgi:hypothetical protein
VRWSGCGACIGERRNAYSVWVRKPREKKILGRSFVGGRIIRIKSILKEYDGMVWTGVTCLITGASGGVLPTRK